MNLLARGRASRQSKTTIIFNVFHICRMQPEAMVQIKGESYHLTRSRSKKGFPTPNAIIQEILQTIQLFRFQFIPDVVKPRIAITTVNSEELKKDFASDKQGEHESHFQSNGFLQQRKHPDFTLGIWIHSNVQLLIPRHAELNPLLNVVTMANQRYLRHS